MSFRLDTALASGTAVGAAVAAGVLFAFSSFVMRGLGALPPAQAVAAMQSVNRYATTPPFMLVLFGTALAAAALGARTLIARPAGGVWLLAGCALYLVGVIGVTIAANVPLNDRLAAADPAAPPATTWDAFAPAWSAWNHVRSAAGIAAALALAVGALKA